MNWRTDVRWAAIMALLAALVMSVLALSYWETSKANERARALAAAEERITSLAKLWSIMQDAETGQRGYVITGLKEYLEPYDAAVRRLSGAIADLHEQYESRPEARLTIAFIRQLAERKMDRVMLIVGVRRTQGFEAAQEVILDHVGKQIMDELRREIGFMTAIERRYMAKAEQGYAAAQAHSRTVFAALSALVLSGMGILLVIAAREMRASRQANVKLRYLANCDPLTGLANRRAFHAALERAIGSGDASGGSFGLFSLDLNGFKSVNDCFGHEAGDQLLVSVAKRLQSTGHASEVLARLGGDEFALLVPDLSSESECYEVISRIKRGIAWVNEENPDYGISGSVGFALFPAHASSKSDLLSLADQRMYLDKRRAENSHRRAQLACPNRVVRLQSYSA